MADPNLVHIAAAAVRDRETGHVFCAAIMSWPAGHSEQIFLRDIVRGDPSGEGGYINAAGGLAYIVSESMKKLTRRCVVRVHVDVDPGEFIRSLELATGSRKANAHEARLLKDMRKPREMFEALSHAIETYTNKLPNDFSISMSPDADNISAVKSYAVAYRDGWPTRTIPAAPSLPSPTPSPR